MAVRSAAVPLTLYLDDETAWLELTAEMIREGSIEDLDFPNLAEYLTDMATRDRREVDSRLKILIAHMLKWTHQPSMRSRSWLTTIKAQQQDLEDLLASRTLRTHAVANLQRVYDRAVVLAEAETGVGRTSFPAECPYSLADIEAFETSMG